jgi:quercetin dioxygenase-like cupin family protein
MDTMGPIGLARRPVILLGIIAGGVSTALLAQQPPPNPPGLTQENILREAIAEFPGTDVVAFNGVFAPGATSGRHRHPGTEVIHVIQGKALVLHEGRGAQELTAGMTLIAQPREKGGSFVHELRNTSETEVLRTYIVLLVDKGEPPALPVE